MSHTRWPVVLVGLGSLGFLADSMAQQNDLQDFSHEATIQFPDDEAGLSKTSNYSSNRWAGEGDNTGAPSARLGGDIQTIESPESIGGRLFNGLRQLSDHAKTRLQGTQLETAQILDIQPGSSRRPLAPQSNLATPSDADPRSFADPNQPFFEYNTRTASEGGPLFHTRETAILGNPPGVISPDRSIMPNEDLARNADQPTNSNVVGSLFSKASDYESETPTTEDEAAKTSGKLPLWPSMVLFASIAANLFFCWIAWDTHSKYQDLVEDMSESDTHLERQKRRLRNEDRPLRRTRNVDDSEFLQAGVES